MMTTDQAIEFVRESLSMMLLLSSPILAAALVMGLIIGILQAVTQIQEQTLAFVPKIVVMGVVAILVAPWITISLIEFSRRMFGGQ